MKARLKTKIFRNMHNPKLHYSINQILVATKGLFLTLLHMKNEAGNNRMCGRSEN